MEGKYGKITELTGLSFNVLGVARIERDWNDVGFKIVDSVEDGDDRIKRALAEGKKVLILPGVYDILHAGHISWIYEAYDAYKRKISGENHCKYAKDDIYVVIPMDNDHLARAEKIKLYKNYGGKEQYLIPIISQERRALSLANIGIVDLVVPIYSPLETKHVVDKTKRISFDYACRLLNQLNVCGNFTEDEYEELLTSLNVYKNIVEPNLELIKKDFLEKMAPLGKRVFHYWDNPSWQLYLFQILFKDNYKRVPLAKNIPNRMISKRDQYDKQACFFMRLCGISVQSILDTYVTSTTQIIAKIQKNNYDFSKLIF